ncbi:hypothetical protein ACWE42_16275 [Sutcliffiella cohnii]
MRKLFILMTLLICFLAGCSEGKTDAYNSDLRSVADNMLNNASEVEKVLVMYSTVWSYSIENRSPIPVQQMAEKIGVDRDVILEHFVINSAGNVPNDFSTNIHSIKSYYESTGVLGNIKEKSDDIKSKISELNNPPKDFENVYDEILDMYTLTEEFLEMALNPKGSLQSFNENFNRLSSDIASKYKRIEVVMPSGD